MIIDGGRKMTTFKQAEHAGWSERAARYDGNFARVASQAVEPVLDRLGDISGMALLDICCGTGDFSAAAQRRGATVTGIDFVPAMVERAAAKVPGATFAAGDAEALDFEDARFDIAVCCFGLLHLEEPDRALAEAARVLKPGGRFAYTTWQPPAKGGDLFRIVGGALKEFGDMAVDLLPAPPVFRFADPAEAESALAAQGFGDVAFDEHVAIWQGETGDDVLELIYKGIVRTPMVIEAQAPDARAAIKARIVEQSEAMRQDGVIRMRWPYCVVAATRA
jgi:SAM-dependent methyltransferase